MTIVPKYRHPQVAIHLPNRMISPANIALTVNISNTVMHEPIIVIMINAPDIRIHVKTFIDSNRRTIPVIIA